MKLFVMSYPMRKMQPALARNIQLAAGYDLESYISVTLKLLRGNHTRISSGCVRGSCLSASMWNTIRPYRGETMQAKIVTSAHATSGIKPYATHIMPVIQEPDFQQRRHVLRVVAV